MKNYTNILGGILLGAVIVFLTMQLIPYARGHHNPPVVREPQWDSPQTRELMVRACFDCHSNETNWPWYSYFAPLSWWVHKDVDGGRQGLNFSEWDSRVYSAAKIYEAVIDGSKPFKSYLLMHSNARLNEQEKQALLQGIIATFMSADR